MKDKELLATAKMRVTKPRLAILAAARTLKGPFTVEKLHEMCGGDLVTVYRTVKALAAAQLLKEVHLRDASVWYEFVQGVAHHHHAVCTGCGLIEELEGCRIASSADIKSAQFASLSEHSLEFFGTCKTCDAV